MQRIGPNALTRSFNWKSPRMCFKDKFNCNKPRIHTVNQQVSFHATNWAKCAHSLIQLEIAKDLLNSNLLQRQVQLQQTERIHTMNQQVSFHATNWTKCAHSLIQLEIAKDVLQRQVQLQQTENSHSESTSQFSRNELGQMRSLTHSIGNRQGFAELEFASKTSS